MKTLMLIPAAALLLSNAAPDMPRPHPPHRAPMIDQVGTSAFEPLLRLNGMSEAGIKALRGARLADGERGAVEAAQCGVIRAATAAPLDLAALDRAIAARDSLAATQANRARTTLIAALRRLDAGDATVLLKLAGPGDMGPGGPGSPPPPGGREGPPRDMAGHAPPPGLRCEG